jgi:predicted transcriptional regulator
MSHKRSKLEIYLEVLKVINKGTGKPTRIMYKTNLSWKPLTKVLDSLQDQGFITEHEDGSHTIYKVTEKGKNVLKYFTEAMELIEIK